jgi:hypothetical protein
LPSSAHHPTLYLPLPDPSSFAHIVHYLYFGSPAFIEEALELGRIRWDGVVRNVEYLGLFEEESGIGIRRWLLEWRERQRRASIVAVGIPQKSHAHAHDPMHAYTSAGSSINPILVEESSEGSTTDDHDSEMADSDDVDDGMEDVYEDDEEDDDSDDWNRREGWDPMVLAIAGMKMADPFALDPHGYARERAAPAVPMGIDSVDPLHG